MAVSIRFEEGAWGGAPTRDLEEVARSVASAFPVFGVDESISIIAFPAKTDDEPPLAYAARGPAGEYLVRLQIQGCVWAQAAYQFAHEFCHVLADPGTRPDDRFAWIEEVLCEAGSLFALRHMAASWSVTPPYPQWLPYSINLATYANKHVTCVERCLPSDCIFSDWLRARIPLLQVDSIRRADNTIIAKELLPFFERDARSWEAIRYLHAWNRSSDSTVSSFLFDWAAVCPTAESRALVGAIASRLT
jgi:hypothetical protein